MENTKTTKTNNESNITSLEDDEDKDLRAIKRSNAEYISSKY